MMAKSSAKNVLWLFSRENGKRETPSELQLLMDLEFEPYDDNMPKRLFTKIDAF